MTAALELVNLTSGYGSSTVVHGVSLEIASGEILALVGKNGMGKSSLLKTILSFLPAWDGAVRIDGRDVTRLAPFRKRALGLAYSPQEQALFQDLSVRDNLRLGLGDDRGFEASLSDISGWFPVLTARLSQRAGTLSGGEQKMLIVARGLIAKPRLLLLDEVTEGLQPSVVDRLAEVLAATRRDRGTAMLVVEQHLSFVLGLADRFAVLKRGEVVDTGSVDAGSAARIDEHMRL
ncbi:ABC transporter ATP-binding protein [Bradyrhizobium erythrophlei]|uniref:Amino acid/amide ABC transporter ATP-binding protein 2, HAAT family n=1 Tax=Bradyrhizobium erythrophlei TaxID=1437360 RepID=A0A1M5R5K1_9BRAD|nr:ABC transporter ATP-binding protein [Bradyrhizobium erythrophlei]SHH21645.1 amino acid/amide ABC transporter ATP-binding protein 2, HAAT family [Bradyrhizobium erythrophlei]